MHEIGHTLGFSHEHQNPKAGITWNEPAVIQSLAGPPNFWDEARTRHNILNKISGPVIGSDWDPASVMHYPFEAGLILEPASHRGGINPVALREEEAGGGHSTPVLSVMDRKAILEVRVALQQGSVDVTDTITLTHKKNSAPRVAGVPTGSARRRPRANSRRVVGA